MTDENNILSPLFLDEKEVRKLIELLFFSYRDFTAEADEFLERLKFGRVHHRIIYFVGKNKRITIKELIKVLQITKQSLTRILHQLVEQNYIKVSIGNDKRTKNIELTSKGNELEKKLSDIQIKRIRDILNDADEKDINGFKKILYKMINSQGKKIFNSINT